MQRFFFIRFITRRFKSWQNELPILVKIEKDLFLVGKTSLQIMQFLHTSNLQESTKRDNLQMVDLKGHTSIWF